jgi:hypothetical protein
MLHGAGKSALGRALTECGAEQKNCQIHLNIIESISDRAHDRQKFGPHGRSFNEKSVF